MKFATCMISMVVGAQAANRALTLKDYRYRQFEQGLFEIGSDGLLKWRNGVVGFDGEACLSLYHPNFTTSKPYCF